MNTCFALNKSHPNSKRLPARRCPVSGHTQCKCLPGNQQGQPPPSWQGLLPLRPEERVAAQRGEQGCTVSIPQAAAGKQKARVCPGRAGGSSELLTEPSVSRPSVRPGRNRSLLQGGPARPETEDTPGCPSSRGFTGLGTGHRHKLPGNKFQGRWACTSCLPRLWTWHSQEALQARQAQPACRCSWGSSAGILAPPGRPTRQVLSPPPLLPGPCTFPGQYWSRWTRTAAVPLRGWCPRNGRVGGPITLATEQFTPRLRGLKQPCAKFTDSMGWEFGLVRGLSWNHLEICSGLVVDAGCPVGAPFLSR
ncbi:uncharacterized protein LOC130835278 [Hippopotamus amphibius kiboko]|uniref:uncharacterized protein LOC130835278 n=1 Tax=Hippopotamus amphibius kiboko TaxID=575201 RepID=UPI002599F8FD|nr:uncharacterized protein LOC130835278 [Hippopotamus amphibius kiboko]